MDNFELVTISRDPDRKFYSVEVEDPAIRTDFEGGYTASRPRHNRNPLRRIWTFGYTDISGADRSTLEDWWNQQKGGSKVWQWFDFAAWDGLWFEIQNGGGTTPPDKTPFRYLVRFGADFKLHFEPKGYGRRLRYDIGPIKIEEA